VRLLHVVPTYLPARRYGGPIFAVHGLCKALAARGHEVHVLTTNVDGPGVSDVPLDTAVDMDGVRVQYHASPFPRLYWSPRMREALAGHAAGYDLVHIHSIFLWPTYAAARAAGRAGVPYVISPRGMLVKELIRQKSRVVKGAWLRLVERRNFTRAAAIHFTSQREWDDAGETGMPLPSPFVIPNGTDLPTLLNVDRQNDLLVSIGRINWKKGLDRLIEAAALLPGVRLVIAGNDEEALVPRLRKLALSRGIGERVTFAGPLDPAERDDLLARATLFILPSLSENFGNVILEALAMETPVVVTPEVGLAADIARDGTGLVANGEPRALAAAIDSLLHDPRRRAAMGSQGRRVVGERYTWEDVARRMEEAYERLRR
jgi:glycosyltransferase involved in cell wall biosynthesis